MTGRWRRLVRWGVTGILVLCVVGGAGLQVIRFRLSSQRRAAIERIRDRGEPVLPSDLVWQALGEGEEPSTWLARIGEVPEEDWSLATLPECAAELAVSLDEYATWEDYESAIFDFATLEPISPCHIAILRREMQVEARVLELALEVDDYCRIDWARRFAIDESGETLFPVLRVSEVHRAVRVLQKSALECALRGETGEALHRLELALQSAALLENSSSLFGATVWVALNSWVIGAIVRVSSLLPPEIRLTDLEARLEVLDARSELRRGLLGERAVGNRIFESFRSGSNSRPEFVPSGSSFFFTMFLDHDQCVYLEHMGKAIQAAEQWEVALLETDWTASRFEPVTILILPNLRAHMSTVERFEALRDLARAALLARREGLEAAREWASAQPDPLGISTLRTHWEEGGGLTIWSAGENGVDDGGQSTPPDEPLDIVVRIQARP